MKKIATLFVTSMLLVSFCALGQIRQKVGSNTTNIAVSASLEIESTAGGFLPPRMTYQQRNAIVSPVAGLIVWCTNCSSAGELQFYNGSTWTNGIGGAASFAVPDAPTSPIATAGNAQASVAFTAPVSNGGSAITSYTVTSSPDGFIASGASSPLTVTGLTNGTAYTFTVTATNVAGSSLASTASAAVTPVTVPDAPTSPIATAGNTQASVAFTAPASNGGSTITSYTVTSSPGGFTATGTTSPLTVTGLTNGTAYTFTVTATNVTGSSLASTASAAVTPATVPDAPTSPIATAGNTQASVAFTAPVSNGGSAITSYTVTSSPGGFTATGTTSPLTVTGLNNGTSYTFTVVATNAIGNSVASAVSAAVNASATVLAQIGTEGDSPNTVASAVTVAQINTISPAITSTILGNQTAYQAYIDANPGLFAAPATAAEVQALVNAVNASVVTSGGTAVVSAYTCSTASAGAMNAGVAVTGVTQTITATVTTAGTYSISTTANGVTFAGSGTFAGTGARTIVLTATGTPTAVGSNTFTLNTTPNCNFSRTSNPAPLPANITLSGIRPYFVASVYDQNYLPYTAPTGSASLATAQAADGANETSALDIQGTLSTTGVTIKIPYTVATASVSLPAFSQTINVPASFTEDNVARNVTFSYSAATLAVGSGIINATLLAVGGNLNAKKLDVQTGIGNDNLGWLLAQFTYAINNSGGTANFAFRNIAAIPDRNYADAAHRMLYLPVLGTGGKTWLNNNLGANYANTTNSAFSPAAQATASVDANAYGSLFQWGRGADGHELINRTNSTTATAVNGSTSTLSATDIPENPLFIITNSIPYDWRSSQNNSFWQGVNGVNNPCPSGYRLPTDDELNAERVSWGSTQQNAEGAFASPLKLLRAGYRSSSNGSLNVVGTESKYWSSTFSLTVTGWASGSHSFSSSGASLSTGDRSFGLAVRCIKN